MRIVLCPAVLAIALFTNAAVAAVLEEFKAEDWNGMAFADDQSGKLANCSVYAQYENGVTLYFFNNADGSWMLGFNKDDWALTQDAQHDISYRVDSRRATNATAIALSNSLLGVSLPTDDPLLRQVRRGNQLSVTYDGTDYSFDLANSDTALDAAQECVSRHLADVAQTESAEPSEGEGAAEATRSDATEEPAPPAEPDVAEGETQAPETDAAASTEAAPAANETASESEASTLGERQEFGPWVVTATDDGAGNFVNCTAFGMHGDDQLIISHYPGDKWEFGLYRGGWALDTNQSYFLWYNIDAPADGPGVIKRPVEAVEPTRIFFEVSSLEDIVARMEGGSTLNVQLRGFSIEPESYSYPLDRAAEAFAATRECTLQHTEAATADSGGTPSGAPSANEPGDDAATVGTLPPIGNETIEDLQVPGWQAGAYGDAGAFTHCAIRAEYDNGTTLGVARTAGGALLLALHRSDWALVAGAPLPATLTIGEAAPVAKSGRALDAAMVVIDLGDEEQAAADLADAKTLVVEVEGKTLEFDTSDIQPGIEAIDACREKHAAAVTDAETDSAEAEPAPEPDATAEAEPEAEPQPDAAAEAEAAPAEAPSPAALKAEAAGYTTALLIRSGYAGHVMLTGDNVPESMRDRHASWQIGEIMGITDVVSGTIEEIKAEVARTDAADCKGTLTTGVEVEDAAGHSHFFSACDGTGLDLAVHYVVVPRSDGGSYMLTFIGIGDGAAAEAIAAKVYQTAAGA
jgi:biotin carboxyl carrier protein